MESANELVLYNVTLRRCMPTKMYLNYSFAECTRQAEYG